MRSRNRPKSTPASSLAVRSHEVGVGDGTRAVARAAGAAEVVAGAVEAAPRLVRVDGGAAGGAAAGAQLQPGDEPEAAHERLLAQLPAQADRGEERPLVPCRQAARPVVAAGQREQLAVREGVVDAAHIRGQLPHAERALGWLRILAGAEVVPELVVVGKIAGFRGGGGRAVRLDAV